jgi:hypothetical protein
MPSRGTDTKLIAYSALPTRFEDKRYLAIEECARKNGYSIVHITMGDTRAFMSVGIKRDDILLTWTVHRGFKEQMAKAFTEKGGRVVCCEEGYFRIVNGEKCFAMAIGDHNGAGAWPVYGPDRWDDFGIALEPWRADRDDSYILVSEQRGIGSTGMASPPNWHDNTANALRQITNRRAVVRWHPKTRINGRSALGQPTEQEQLAGAHAVVTWSSALAVHALAAGIPVFYQAPHFIAAEACLNDIREIERPLMDDGLRLSAMRKLAWAQWRRSEIENGEALSHLLRRP